MSLLVPSDGSCIYLIILRVRPDEADIDRAVRIVDSDDEPVLVAADIEDNPVATDDAAT
jgi:hypothetical protein